MQCKKVRHHNNNTSTPDQDDKPESFPLLQLESVQWTLDQLVAHDRDVRRYKGRAKSSGEEQSEAVFESAQNVLTNGTFTREILDIQGYVRDETQVLYNAADTEVHQTVIEVCAPYPVPVIHEYEIEIKTGSDNQK